MFSLTDFMEDEDRALQDAVGPVAEAGSVRAQGRRRGGVLRAKAAGRAQGSAEAPTRRSEARRRPGA